MNKVKSALDGSLKLSKQPLIDNMRYLVNEAQNPQAIFVFAHGAGADMSHSFIETVTTALVKLNISVLRFNFPYMIKRAEDGKRRPPDRMPALTSCYHQHLSQCLNYFSEIHKNLPIIIGGKSMGGRVAATICASVNATTINGTNVKETNVNATNVDMDTADNKKSEITELPENVKGLVCIGYPFHPIKKPETLRSAPLIAGYLPTLIIQGDRDALGSKEEIATYALPAHCSLHFLPDGDHDLKPRVKSGFTHHAHIETAITRIAEFVHAQK